MHRSFSAHHDADSAPLQGMEALRVQRHGLMIFPGMNIIASQQGSVSSSGFHKDFYDV